VGGGTQVRRHYKLIGNDLSRQKSPTAASFFELVELSWGLGLASGKPGVRQKIS